MLLRTYAVLVTVLVILIAGVLLATYYGKGWLTFQTAAYIATVAGAFIGTATLVNIATQVKRQTHLATAANSQALVSVSSQFVLRVAGDEKLAELWLLSGAQYDTMPDGKKAQYRYLAQWWLTFYENVQYQNDCGLLDPGVYKAWDRDMVGFIERRHTHKYWGDVRMNYSDSFIAHFERSMKVATASCDAS
jgi:hypothetical protein